MYSHEKFIQIIENYVEIDKIKNEDNFKLDLGMSSFETMCLITDVKEEFSIELKAADFIKHKTVGEMSEYLANK